MAAVKTSSERVLNKVAIASVLIITLIFLAPIYWITSTAFKPRNLSTTIPPTVLFQPEVSPFVKLFTKRSQLRAPATPEEYEAAPWWERLVFDGGVHHPSLLDGVVKEVREIRDVEFCTIDQVRERAADFTARRIEAALASLRGDGPPYTESGR